MFDCPDGQFFGGLRGLRLSPLSSTRSQTPIPPQTVASMEALGSSATAPVLIRTYKKEAEFEIWKQKSDGHYALLKILSDVPLVGAARTRRSARATARFRRGSIRSRPAR